MTRIFLLCILILAAWFSRPVWADEPRSDRWQIGIHSYAQIMPSNDPVCVAEVHIFNFETDNLRVASGSVWLGDLHVGMTYELNVGPLASETYYAYPMDGYYAAPPELTVMDKDTGIIRICPFVGM